MSNNLQKLACSSVFTALAFAVAGGSAHAAEACDLTNGLAVTTQDFIEEAKVCVKGTPDVQTRALLESELVRLTGVARGGASKSSLQALDSLNEAARLHAMDMAVRGYAAHYDPEGRSHLDRVRQLDRVSLFGAFGANVTVVPAGASAKDIQLALLSDPANAENLLRTDFTHLGVGVAQKDGQIYVVQLFAERAGVLDAPLSATVASGTVVKANFANPAEERTRWMIVAADGAELSSGRGQKLAVTGKSPQIGYLTIEARARGAVSQFKGPAVTVN